METRVTNNVQQEALGTLEGQLFEITRLPLDQLPEINSPEEHDKLLFNVAQLRLDYPGENFHNLPVLGFGVEMRGDEAELSVPTEAYINQVVETHNPGGFTFVETASFDSTHDFLARIAKKQYPLSRDKTPTDDAIPDNYKNFINGRDPNIYLMPNDDQAMKPKSSLYVHDRADHLALVALDADNADVLALFAGLAAENGDDSFKQQITGGLDRIFDLLSTYATIKSGDDDLIAYKDYVWELISEYTSELDKYPRLFSVPNMDNVSLSINRHGYDDNIVRMQSLEKPANLGGETNRALGSVALAA